MAYKYRSITPRNNQPAPAVDIFESAHPYRQFGHYVLGGLDVTGEHLDSSTSVTYDSDEDIDGGCSVDSLCDPTVGFFDVAESMGADVAMQVEQIKSDNQ